MKRCDLPDEDEDIGADEEEEKEDFECASGKESLDAGGG